MANKLIISDSGPLISMMKIARLDLLNEMYGEVVIPKTVYNEITSNKKFPSERKMIEAVSFITVVDVADNVFVQSLMKKTNIHRGEAEAICLIKKNFKNQNVSLLIDDGEARFVAKNEGIHIVGTIGTLEKALKEKLITKEESSQYADIFESTKRYYSKSELQLLRNPQEPQIPQKPQEIAVHPNLGKITDKFYSKKLC